MARILKSLISLSGTSLQSGQDRDIRPIKRSNSANTGQFVSKRPTASKKRYRKLIAS
ncbi:uncharacterized protein BKA55DRAFT_269344 [Fusarium redolens]|uniref:Uncharacterized protein n=1 Tax=Fusarium redolens TaxID=48865 RepID=A0A9P9HPC7_FUSRE|nr:uncharacterized protein BKA55DRAFT_269344 [Fusarium redolens]KAH7260747.1 hypothetical protein BKA55DRAFT_269344 [Fusarium redolens]